MLVESEDGGEEEVEEEEDDEDEEEGEDVKFISESSGGFVAVFSPVKLVLHTGQVSCCRKQTQGGYGCLPFMTLFQTPTGECLQ